MEQSGSKNLGPENPTLTPAEQFMSSEVTEQKAVLSKITTVSEIEGLLPSDISSWNKDTTALVLEKTLGLCGISTKKTEEKTEEENRLAQESVQRQIDVLKSKMEANSRILAEHRRKQALRDALLRQAQDLEARVGEVEATLGRGNLDGGIRHGLEMLMQQTRQQVAQIRMNPIELPLRDE